MDDPDAPVPTFGGLILAGGRSSRMGRDKTSLPYRGMTLLQHMREILTRSGAAPVLVGGGREADVEDVVGNAGPVGSLCALARYSGAVNRRWLAVPVDMPLLAPQLLLRLTAAGRAAFFEGYPLPVAFSLDTAARAVLARAEERLRAGQSVAVRDVLGELGAVALPAGPTDHAQLVNTNTPEEWARLTGEDSRGPS